MNESNEKMVMRDQHGGFLIGLLLLIASVLSCVVITELFLRSSQVVYVPAGIPNLRGRMSFPDREEGYFSVATNRYGYRSADISLQKKEDEYRVLVLGDSHAFGTGVSDRERFSERFVEALAAKDEKGITYTVINAAIWRQSFPEYLFQLRRGLRYEPDMVVWTLYSGNDLFELVQLESGKKKRLQAIDSPNLKRQGISGMLREFVLWHLIENFFLKNKHEGTESDEATFDIRHAIEGQSFTQAQFFLNKQSDINDVALRAKRYLRKGIAMVSNRGISLQIVLLPSKFQVDALPNSSDTKREMKKLAEELGYPLERLMAIDREAYEQIKKVVCELAPDSIDALSSLRNDGREMYWPRDLHLNSRGHEAIADLLVACRDAGKACSKLCG